MIWEIHAIRYASVARLARDCFVDNAAIADVPMGLDFFVWLARSGAHHVLIDCGFGAPAAQRRGRPRDIDPVEALARLGTPAGRISDLIVTHLHYDHAGNMAVFPDATIHIQAAETAYASGPRMTDAAERRFFEADDIAAFVRLLHEDRVRFHQGDAEIAPGLSVHLAPGHTAGMQCVRVHTRRGVVVLASDVSHYYGNYMWRNPFPAIWDRAAVFAAYDRLHDLADSPDHIVPGHDPEVLRIYPRLANDAGIDAVALHLPPLHKPDLDRFLHSDKDRT